VAAWARVGGGHSYSGPSDSDFSSGGGGDGGDSALAALVVRLLFWLILEHPAIGIPLTIAVVVGWMLYQRKHPRPAARRVESNSFERQVSEARPESAEDVRTRLDDLNFSRPLFLDFARLLFVRGHEARGKNQFDSIRPYVHDNAMAELARLSPGVSSVSDVVVGSATITKITQGGGRALVDLLYEANYTEQRAGKAPVRLYVKEQWRLGKKLGVLSKGPGEITAFGCPSCGSTQTCDPQGRCPACGQIVNRGDFHWQVVGVRVLAREPPTTLAVGSGGGGVERGLERPTVFASDFAVMRKSFAIAYPDFSWPAFEARVKEALQALNAAWSSKDWSRARPFETDYLFDTHRFWIDRYIQSGLTNRVEQIEILKITPCKIEQDAFLDAITVRVFVKALDYTVRDATGEVVDGSRTKPREYSEYWTFIRKTGFDPNKRTAAASCPSCGAPLSINMAGVCGYCLAHITSGEFDWVLCAIDQDESYRG
jgi:predicted lipid-binding transport protein (Tim44 family)